MRRALVLLAIFFLALSSTGCITSTAYDRIGPGAIPSRMPWVVTRCSIAANGSTVTPVFTAESSGRLARHFHGIVHPDGRFELVEGGEQLAAGGPVVALVERGRRFEEGVELTRVAADGTPGATAKLSDFEAGLHLFELTRHFREIVTIRLYRVERGAWVTAFEAQTPPPDTTGDYEPARAILFALLLPLTLPLDVITYPVQILFLLRM